MFWNQPKFKELQQQWEKKLAESGFVDAEKTVNGERVLRQAADYPLRETSEVVRETKLTYFMLLAQFIASERGFADEWDRLIMERTAEGKSIREISDELKSLCPDGRERTKHNRDTIRYVRRRYEHRWGIKVWSPEQMQSRKPRTK